MESRFKILYSGELRDDIRAQDAIRGLASRFKIPEDQARTLILGRKERILKRDVDADTAESLRLILEGIGLVVRVEPLAAARPPDLGLVPQDPRHAEPDLAEPDAATAVFLRKAAPPAPSVHGGPTQDRFSEPGARESTPAASGTPLPSASSPLPPPLEAGLGGPHARGFTAGWGWLVRGLWHFKADPWPWLGAVVILYVLTIAVGLIPMVGAIASTILGPMLTGGLMLGAQAQQRGEGFRVEHLFAGFGDRAGQLALIGIIYLVGGIAISLVVGLWVVGAVSLTMSDLDVGALGGEDPAQVMQLMGPALVLPFLVALLLALPLAMALLLAPPLVALDGLTALAAMRLSFRGCLNNLLPFLLYGLLATLLLFVGTLLFLVGLVVVTPVLFASLYAAYRDIFFEPGWR